MAVGNWTKPVISSESGHCHSYAARILALATEKVLIGLGERASCLRPREPLLFLKGNKHQPPFSELNFTSGALILQCKLGFTRDLQNEL